MTDPTPRTAATARDALESITRRVRRIPAHRGWYIDHSMDLMHDEGEPCVICDALAAAEAPGRVAALEAAGMRAARDAHAAWLRAGIGQHTPTLIEECPNEWCREHVAALAAPAPPAGVSGEVCLGCGEPSKPRRIPCCSNCSCSIPFAPAPTPIDPVARCWWGADHDTGYRGCGEPKEHVYHLNQQALSIKAGYVPDGLAFAGKWYSHPYTPGGSDE